MLKWYWHRYWPYKTDKVLCQCLKKKFSSLPSVTFLHWLWATTIPGLAFPHVINILLSSRQCDIQMSNLGGGELWRWKSGSMHPSVWWRRQLLKNKSLCFCVSGRYTKLTLSAHQRTCLPQWTLYHRIRGLSLLHPQHPGEKELPRVSFRNVFIGSVQAAPLFFTTE